jgi:WD40 repeat protein
MNDLCGQTIRGYELLEQIGAGAYGAIYRARQPVVDREVAIKIILPEHASRPDFIRRFEVEAQLVARMEHLHIVPLYDYWRDPEGAYLVMRLMKGGTLGRALERGPLSLSQVTLWLEQICSALAVAHRQGVIHRDLKPGNILLDEEGNAYLSDFGIAKVVRVQALATATIGITGTPAYISPEQVQGRANTPQTDIYSLGVMLFEMLTGQHPFRGFSSGELIVKHMSVALPSVQEVRPDLPVELDRVIQCATAKDPAARYADVTALVTDFRRALSPETATRVALPITEQTLTVPNPYKGLRAFQEADALDFFGREALTAHLLTRLAPAPSQGEGRREGDSRFLAVVGPSGSGKSSVVKAGLLPALRHGALPGSGKWFVVEMLPGPHPLEELEVGLLRIAAHQPGGLMEQLRRDERGLARAARLVLPSADSTLLLIIDQFEEVFTLIEDKAEARHFLDSLYTAVTDPRSPVRVILTLRADFYDRPLMHPDFSDLMSKRTEVVVPLTTDELARAIAGPAERVGARLEPGLVTDIAADIKQQPGALPLLQYALTELFERREGRLLTRQAYQSIGGVMGALGRRAEEVYAMLDPASQDAARQLFLRLVTLGEGVEDTRRRVLRTELISLTPQLPLQSLGEGAAGERVMDAVIETFGKARLLSFDRDPATRGSTVEVAHEALLREWKRLREWLDASRADVRLLRMLAAAAAEWVNAERDASFLLQGARLAQFEGSVAGTKLALTHDERMFLEASLAERQKHEAEEAARQRRELEAARKLAETEKRRAEEQTRAAGRLRQRALLLAGALLVAVGLAFAAVWLAQRARTERNNAEYQRQVAFTRELSVNAVNNLRADPERSILLALQAVSVGSAGGKPVLVEAEEALHRAVQESRLRLTIRGHTAGLYRVAHSPDGKRLATASIDKTAKVWDVASGQELLTLRGHSGFIAGVAFSPDGTRLATASLDKTAKVWDAATGKELLTLIGHTGGVGSIVFTSDGKRLATSCWNDELESTARVWDADTGKLLLTLMGHTNGLWDIASSPDGKRLATCGSEGTAKIWDSASGRLLTTIFTQGVPMRAAFSPDGTRLAAGGADGLAKLWDTATGRLLQTLAGHTGEVWGASFSPDGLRLATGSRDGTARVWDISPSGSRDWLTIAGHTLGVPHLAYSPDGARLATASGDKTAKVWDTLTGKELLTLSGHTKGLKSIAFDPDGSRLATTSADQTVRLWDSRTGKELLSLPAPAFPFPMGLRVGFSPDGKRIAAATAGGTAKVWDAATGKELLTLDGHTEASVGITFSPDGARIAIPYLDRVAKVWDAATGQELLTLSGHGAGLWAVAFSPDGRRIATASQDGTAKVWDAATGQVLLTLSGHIGSVLDVAFSPDGAHVATASGDGTARLWDVSIGSARSKQPLVFYNPTAMTVTSVAFSPDGKRLAASSADGTVRIYALPLDDIIAIAKSRVTRALTTDECRKYLHVDKCP